MIPVKDISLSDFFALMAERVKDYALLVKFRLNLTVVFSALMGYSIATIGNFEFLSLLLLGLGGFFITGSANAINQVLEKDYDKLMVRTQNRPVAAGRMSVTEGLLIAGINGVIGAVILSYFFNSLTAFIGVLSLLLYAFIYTPLKRVGNIAVAIGAIPGALPPLIGWTAATGSLGYEAYLLFSIQFLWQFPHFWAIGWLGADEYAKAGFKFHSGADDKSGRTSRQITAYIFFLILLTLYPVILGIFSYVFAAVALILGLMFLFSGINLVRNNDRRHALQVMIASILYLPLLQVAMVLDLVF